MNTDTSLFSDSFSWQRVMMVARFYWPRLRTPLLLFVLVSAVSGFLNAWLMQSVLGLVISALPSMILAWIFYLFPLIFTRNQSPVTETLLPATAAEKSVFFIVMCLLVNPILVYIPYYTLNHLSSLFFTGDITELISMLTEKFFTETKGVTMFQALPPLATCMYVVFSRWRNRVGLAIGFTIAAVVGLTILGASYGIYLAFNAPELFCDHQAGESFSAGFEKGFSMVEYMKPFTIGLSICSIIYAGIMSWLTCRSIRTNQV